MAGIVEFTAQAPGLEIINDTYEVAIEVPDAFPRQLPTARDIGRRIPLNYHRLTDGSFCLGSEVRLRLILANTPTLPAFIERCVIPYLYGFSFFERYGSMPFGELGHGQPGLIEDFKVLLRLNTAAECINMLELIGLKRRVANKRPCPCSSGKRLGTCHHKIANRLRPQLGRGWCRIQAKCLSDNYHPASPPQLTRQAVRRVTSQSEQGDAAVICNRQKELTARLVETRPSIEQQNRKLAS